MSGVVKRSLSIRGHATSISLEDAFLAELTRIATERGMALAALVAEIDAARERTTNLSSALRLHVLADLKARVAGTTGDALGAGLPPRAGNPAPQQI